MTVFASRREVHEVLKNVACIMMALAAIPILTHFAGGNVHNRQDPDLLRGAFVLVLSIRLCALSTLLLAIRFYASCSQKWALGFFIAASLAQDILNQHVAVVLLMAGFTLRLALPSCRLQFSFAPASRTKIGCRCSSFTPPLSLQNF